MNRTAARRERERVSPPLMIFTRIDHSLLIRWVILDLFLWASVCHIVARWGVTLAEIAVYRFPNLQLRRALCSLERATRFPHPNRRPQSSEIGTPLRRFISRIAWLLMLAAAL